jgi:C-terminal processing protease CtpA/Prc
MVRIRRPTVCGYDVYVGPLVDSEPGENLYGMTWDTLWGEAYSDFFRSTNEQFKQDARGVILDHRAGNGGTIDAPEAITELVRPRLEIAIALFDRPSADYEGPATEEDALAVFDRYKGYKSYPDLTYTVGSNNPKVDLPVALLLHRDGSASDFLPFGMKGAPNVRIFGPQPTAGAFSTFFQFSLGGSLRLQMASGDTISYQGKALIGSGAEPDEIVLPLQSDLLYGRDTIYLRALAWVRSELEP